MKFMYLGFMGDFGKKEMQQGEEPLSKRGMFYNWLTSNDFSSEPPMCLCYLGTVKIKLLCQFQ